MSSMPSLQALLDSLENYKTSIIYGNLSRNIPVFMYYIRKKYPYHIISVQSPIYEVPEMEDVFVNSPPTTDTNLMIYIEPLIRSQLILPMTCSNILVLTSHLNFKYSSDDVHKVTFYLTRNLDLELATTKRLNSIQLPTIECKNVASIEKRLYDEYGYFQVKVVMPTDIDLEKSHFHGETCILIDLTSHEKNDSVKIVDLLFSSVLEMFDKLKRIVSNDLFLNWKICLPVGSRDSLMDHLTCNRDAADHFEPNMSLTPISAILELHETPFYRKNVQGDVKKKSQIDNIIRSLNAHLDANI